MEGTVAGVRILPAVVQFHDADAGILHQMSLKVQNLSKFSKTVKFHAPDSKFFSVKVKNPDKPIAPGLDVTALVEYYTDKDEDQQDRAILLVDNDIIEIPLIAFSPSPQLEICGPVDFGSTVADGKILTRYFSIDNYGTKTGEFKIKYNGKQPISLTPTSGIVQAETSQKIKVEFISKTCGDLKEVVNVKLEGQESSSVEILGKVVERNLQLLHLESKEEVKFIKFGATYYGTDHIQSFLLHNNGPDIINYVVVLEEGGDGQEVGLDLSKSATILVASQQRSLHSEDDEEDLTSLVTVFPNQGELGPGEMGMIHFKFSPRFRKSNFGWKNTEEVDPRKDYALFMHVEVVGSINKTEEGTFKQGCKLEIAVTGTAIPIDISISPGVKLLFGECAVGDHIDILSSFTNNSSFLPVTFAIKPVAHFHPKPLKGLLKPSQSSDMMISFKPNQMGTFNSKLEINLLGAVLDPSYHSNSQCKSLSAVKYKQVVIDKLCLQLQGLCCRPQTKSAGNLPRSPRTADGDATQRLHSDTLHVAQPNDRASSIRPADRRLKIKTKFTGVERYSYIDPDFALTDQEEKRKQDHTDLYLNYIRDSRTFREMKAKKRELQRWEGDQDLGIKPAQGLIPPKLSTKEASFSEKVENESIRPVDRLLSTKSLSTAKSLVEGLNAIPLTDIEKLDCSKILSPQELRKIEIESTLIDFGEVCQRSVATKYLTVGNNLDQHIHIVVKIDCRELRQSSPLSQVIPPRSVARINLLFESNSKGVFERSIDYTINDRHHFHVVATAQVVAVALEISCDKLTLKPTASMAVESGFRSVVTIINKRNFAADFTWQPLNCKDGTSFSIRPAKGTVEAFSSLDGEVVFYPSFSSEKTTQFALHVEGGNKPKLLCEAQCGPAQCSFVERRFVMGCVPLHLTTVRRCHLKNTSQNHAYFQIANTQPLPGMMLTPKQGVVPVGGTTEIKVEFTPDYVHKFDTEIEVNVLGAKTISLRVGGTAEQPCVDVDVGLLQFNGVYCGATAKLSYKLINKARSKVNVVFDLSRYRDFSLEFLDHNDKNTGVTQHDDGVFTASLLGLEVVDCVFKFKPTEVASYNFVLPVTINDTTPPCPAPSTIPPSPAPSRTNWTIPELDTPPPVPPRIATPSRRVFATALRPPLQLSHTHLKFSLPAGYFDLGIESDAGRVQTCILVNNSNKPCTWSLDISTAAQSLFDNGIYTFLQRSGSPYPQSSNKTRAPRGTLQSGETFQFGVLFSPPSPGVYNVSIPVILNDDHAKAYRILELEGELLSPEIRFEPKTIDFKVVPLAIENTVEFEIVAKGYRKSCEIHHELPEVEMNDGSRVCLLESNFPKGTLVSPCYSEGRHQGSCRIPCKLIFKSLKPVSFSTHIVFTVAKERYFLPVSATADNCLLTNYPFLALHRNDYHITCESKHELMANGDDNTSISTDAFLLPCITSNRPQTFGSTSATSTTFGISTSSYEDSSNPSSSLRDTPSPGETTVHNGIARHAELDFDVDPHDLITGATPAQVIFYKEVLKAVQRWFSMQAWSSGAYPIKIPKYFQNAFQEGEESSVIRSASWDRGVKRDRRTIFQLVAHICGRHIPGIPVNAALPSERCDRMRKLHWMYTGLLVFLRAQGALLARVNPEDLMSFNDYVEWKLMEEEEKQTEAEYCSVPSRDENEKRKDYERLSSMAWTDLLLQLLKVFVLGRVTPHQFKKVSYPPEDCGVPFINPDPLCSNIYGVGERILLSWLNHHYKEQKQKTWSGNSKGSLPSARWIVNFDLDFMDGLVLAAVLAAHCPFLVTTHLQDMFLHPITAEQCLHNAVQVVEAFKVIHLDYDIVATDITEANSVSILLLCLHLYHHLPQYIPRTTVDFTGSLHFTITKYVKLQNPSSKPLLYRAVLCGQDAQDFATPMGDNVQVAPKGQMQLPVEFKSRFLRPCNATLVLIGKRAGSACGNTLVFTLRTSVDNITPRATIKCESPLYEINKIDLDISNPFPQNGKFRVVLVEARGHLACNSDKEKKTKTKPKRPIESKTDHGQSRKQKSSKKEPILPIIPEKIQDPQLLSQTNVITRAFWCTSETIHLESNDNSKVEINFVPFQVGHRQCSVLLINEDIGEFLYLIETETVLPLPSRVLYVPSAHSVRVSSSLAAAHHGRGTFGGDDRVLYWKCENNESFSENIMIPRTNMARENALAAVGQQNMSRKELRRRELTNTLNITSVTTAMALLGITPNSIVEEVDKGLKVSSPRYITFNVESSSKHFSVPSTVTVSLNPSSAHDSGTPLPVQFTPRDPGHYPTQIILKATNDTRVYQIECTVSPAGGLDAELEFTTPLHQSVTQDIPLINHTRQDWQLMASVEGEGFYGPPVMVAKACMTSFYPLMFRPSAEDCVKGKLVLTNVVDGTEHVYRLKGVGDAPMASEHIVIECQARKTTIHTINIPNMTKKKTEFKIVSDLDIVTGSSHITTRTNKTTEYELTVFPWKRGEFSGVISFVATSFSSRQSNSTTSKCDDSDTSDDEEYSVSYPSSADYTPTKEPNSDLEKPYRFWYSIEIHAFPPPPEKVLDVCCRALSAVGVEITVSNPSNNKVMMNVLIEGDGLFGPPVVLLEPKQQTVYQAKYAPTMVGKQEGSLIFQHESVGEFWYKLNLIADEPEPKHLPAVQSELGSHTHQAIQLENPTGQTLLLTPYSSNQRNFALELDNSKQLSLPPHTIIEVPLRFTPSAIGSGNHKAKIVFRSEQLGDWAFLASGTGLNPSPSDPLFVHGMLSENTSLIVPFRNPTEHTVVVEVNLKESVFNTDSVLLSRSNEYPNERAFCLLLKHNEGILLKPQEILDIPLTFTPSAMKCYEATVTVSLQRYDQGGLSSDMLPSGILPSSLMRHLSWIFPVKGIPVSHALTDSRAITIECQSRDRTEQMIELTLSEVVPSTARSLCTSAGTGTPFSLVGKSSLKEAEFGVDNVPFTENFSYEFLYSEKDSQDALERSLGIQLEKKYRNKTTGVVTLIFRLIFSPYKPFNHLVHLILTAGSGGVWKFPVRFLAREAEVDDSITIEAAGLNKEAVVGFRLTSQCRQSVPFVASLARDSDPEFSLSCSSTILLPQDSEGTLIKVAYKPTLYGKIHKGKIIIQTGDMQWTYSVKGVTPEYTPPTGQSVITSKHTTFVKQRKKNYVRDNLRLQTTAVSSPIKGAPLVQRGRR